MKTIHLSLLSRVLIAIALGVLSGLFVPDWFTRIFLTFNGIFSQLLGFMIPLIIVGLVTVAIGDLGHGAGKMLLVTVLLAYLDTVIVALGGFGVGSTLFPGIVSKVGSAADLTEAASLSPYFTISIPAMFDVMTALLFAFIMGLCIANTEIPVMKSLFREFKIFVSRVIEKLIIPLLPVYIYGIFLDMTATGKVFSVLKVFALIIVVIFVLHIIVIIYEFAVAGLFTKKNPFKLLWNMLPAYFTALGTSS